MESPLGVLAVEPWFGGSHKSFLHGLCSSSRHDFRLVTLPDRFWKWRMHGGAVTLAKKARELQEDGFSPDVIFATDMLNLPAFLALTRDRFADLPVVLFMHENQLTYPIPEDRQRDYTYAYINFLSCLTADHILFNSHFHLKEFMEALPSLLGMLPDYTHLDTVHGIQSKSSVLHLGMDLAAFDDGGRGASGAEHGSATASPVVLWNQRWEYDKNPDAFFRVMDRLDEAGCLFRLILAGEHAEERPEVFEEAAERYGDRISHYGYVEDFAKYSSLLHQADIVVSTSLHEFFGVAIMEAIYCGCHPLLPNRLSYPELIPSALPGPPNHSPILYETEDDLCSILESILRGTTKLLTAETLRTIPARLDWRKHVVHYDDLITRVVDQKRTSILVGAA